MSAAARRLHRPRTDSALLHRFRAGDDSAFALLHDRYAADIRSYAQFMLRGSPHDPDDAAQDVFLRAYQALRRDERNIDLRPWLFRVAHNRCIDVLRRPSADGLDDDLRVASGADPAIAVAQRESLRVVLRDIGALPDAQRSALLLRELAGLSHATIADSLGISTTASRMLVHRARLALTDAAEARDTTCLEVRERLAAGRDTDQKPARRDRRHLSACRACAACQRAHAHVDRELALIAPAGLGLAGLIKSLTGGLPAGGAAASATSAATTTGGAATKLAIGACCAALSAGATATTLTRDDHNPRRPPPASTATATPHTTAAAKAAEPATSPPGVMVYRRPMPAPATTASRARPHRARAVPQAIDLRTLEGAHTPVPATPHARAPQTIDLGDLETR
jgi:RNA polymerase sigma factor (sigma-70 family)